MAAKLVVNLPAELFWASAVVDIRVAGLERAIRQRVEVSKRDSS